jgi:stalled ribosome rescue protein Dom34
MKTQKNLGIWMDYAKANLIDLESKKKSHIISSSFTSDIKQEVLERSEYTMNNKERQMDEAFYKEISEKMLNYNHVLLFGPTNAKSELHNYLKKDLHFNDIKIDVKPADKMTDNQQVAFVKDHFEK